MQDSNGGAPSSVLREIVDTVERLIPRTFNDGKVWLLVIGAIFILLGYIAVKARGSEFLIITSHIETVDAVIADLMMLPGLVISSLGAVCIHIETHSQKTARNRAILSV